MKPTVPTVENPWTGWADAIDVLRGAGTDFSAAQAVAEVEDLLRTLADELANVTAICRSAAPDHNMAIQRADAILARAAGKAAG